MAGGYIHDELDDNYDDAEDEDDHGDGGWTDIR